MKLGKKGGIGLLLLIAAGVFVFLFMDNDGNISGNLADKSLCEKSGGSWESGFGETSGTVYFCKCPGDSYSENSECKTITNNEVQLCNQMSNDLWDCAIDNKESYPGIGCWCSVKTAEGGTSKLPISWIKNSNCECYSNSCGCDSLSN